MTPLFYHIDGDKVTFLYKYQLECEIATFTNLGGAIDWITSTNGHLVSSLEELVKIRLDHYYKECKIPAFPCVMIKLNTSGAPVKKTVYHKYEYFQALEESFISLEQIEEMS